MKKNIYYCILLLAAIALDSCIFVKYTPSGTEPTAGYVIKEERNPSKIPVANPDIQSGSGYSYLKLFSASDTRCWYKIATIKNENNLGKHICSFDVYSGQSPHTGVYYASFFLNLRRGNDYYGHFYCTAWGKDAVSDFSPDDFCVTYTGKPHGAGETTTIIWKKASSSEDSWFVGIKFVEFGITSFQFAENSYYGAREHTTSKPSVADGYDYVIDVESAK